MWHYLNLSPSQLIWTAFSNKCHPSCFSFSTPFNLSLFLKGSPQVGARHLSVTGLKRKTLITNYSYQPDNKESPVIPYLLTSHILLVLSLEAEATKSPHECHEQSHTAWACPLKVKTHPPFERSHIRTVVSPLEVTNWVPLLEGKRKTTLERLVKQTRVDFTLKHILKNHIFWYITDEMVTYYISREKKRHEVTVFQEKANMGSRNDIPSLCRLLMSLSITSLKPRKPLSK